MNIPFVGPAYTARSTNVDAQRCINLYAEVNAPGAKSVLALYGTPGMLLWATLNSLGPVRGMHVAQGYLYAVAGATLYKVNSAAQVTTVGALLTSSGKVSMDDNGTQLMLVDGTYGYIVTLATADFALITDADFPGADVVYFEDGYFIFNVPGTGQFMITALYDGTSVDSLDIATAEGSPDDTVSLIVDHREVWLFGELSTEVWFNSGDSDFPFERMQGAFIEQGCAAKHSPAKLDNSVFWLGKDDKGQGIVWKANGYSPARISTHAIEEAIRGYSDISDAIGFTYEQSGHGFYVLTFPTGNATWVYDASSQLWHERQYRDPNLGTSGRHRANCFAFFAGKRLIGDSQSGKIYEWALDTYTDDSNPILRKRAAQHIHEEENRLRHNALEIDFERGVGLVTGQGSDPQAMLRWSDDGGHTWSNEHWTTIGAIGRTKTRARWPRLGVSRDRVYEVSVTDPVKVVIIGANLDAVPLPS